MNDYGIQQATALKTVEQKLSKEADKVLFVLTAEDITSKNGYKLYASYKIDKSNDYTDLLGVEITESQFKKIATSCCTWGEFEKVLTNLNILSLSIPNSKIISIRNMGYKSKK